MRLHHLLVGLAVIFISIIAVEGLPQSASPTPYPSASPQAVESPAKKQPAKKKGWWIFGSKGFAGQSDRDPYEQLAGCRSRQNEEAKKKSFRHGNTDRGYRVTARDRHEGGRDSRAGRR